jgi:hypothetical protein
MKFDIVLTDLGTVGVNWFKFSLSRAYVFAVSSLENRSNFG